MSRRAFGSVIGNMTGSNSNDISDVQIVRDSKPVKQTEQMDKTDNRDVISRLPKPLAIEVYTKIHNSTLSKDDLLDEIEDLVDQKFYIGEKLMSSGTEYTVVSSEKRGGLTLYQMEDGSKIGHRDLRRKKGLSMEEIKQIAIEDAELIDEKVWKVKEELLRLNPIKEVKKFAPIFSSANRKARVTPTTVTTLDSESDSGSEDDGEKNGGEGEERAQKTHDTSRTPRPPRAYGGPATTATRRALNKKKEKEQKEREKLEKKEKEKEEKRQKKEEEKAKKLKEKEDKLKAKEEKQSLKSDKKEKNGTMDKFVRKEANGSTSNGPNALLFSPSKWGERRVACGVKKLDDAWKKRDLEAFNEASVWCEKNLSGNQRNSIENPIYKFAVQKTVDKSKDKLHMKGMKWALKAEYKQEMAEKRKSYYGTFEPKIKAWFSEDIALDDLLIASDPLSLIDAKAMECDEELLKCMEISQFFVSMRKILLWNENVSAEQLLHDLHNGFDGFQRSTYKMLANLLETALQEKEHEKTAHCNARLSEFPITEHTITELVRAFFIGNFDMSFKRDSRRGGANVDDDCEGEELDDIDSEEHEVKSDERTEENKTENAENPEEPADSQGAAQEKQRILSLFSDECHIYDWPSHAQLEILYTMKEVVHGLPIIREWFLRDANSEKLTGLKNAATNIGKKIEQFNQQLQDLPSFEISEDMTRTQAREMEKVIKKRQMLEKQLDELKDELEENREATARERDDLERIFRVIHIGTDRHLRKYYWFAHSSDAGIWIQDFGTTSYEKWVRDCAEKGFMDVESLYVENRPEYEDLPVTSSESLEIWYKLNTEPAILHLVKSLEKNGKREKMLKKYMSNNIEDILASIRKPEKKKRLDEDQRNTDDIADEEEEEDANGEDEHDGENGRHRDATSRTEKGDMAEIIQECSRFSGPFGSLKKAMSEFLSDWKQSGISKLDVQIFDTKLMDANNMDEMKRLVIELVTSIPIECLIEKFPQNVAIAKKCFSQLKMPRFCRRVQEATNTSCLHMLLAYFDARIDQQKTLHELPCQVCRKKAGTQRKLMCKQCAIVFHHGCHKPPISRELFEEDGFKEGWWCVKCTKEDRRRQLIEANEQKREREEAESEGGGASDSEGDVDGMEEEEEGSMSRGRSAKRKANAAMRSVLEFEGVLRNHPAPPPLKKQKAAIVPEVQELFNSIERANPRLYKVLQQIPSQTRSTRLTHHETRSLPDIEQDLDVYESADLLHDHLTQFFQQARGYLETHNPRKLDELDSLISELNFI